MSVNLYPKPSPHQTLFPSLPLFIYVGVHALVACAGFDLDVVPPPSCSRRPCIINIVSSKIMCQIMFTSHPPKKKQGKKEPTHRHTHTNTHTARPHHHHPQCLADAAAAEPLPLDPPAAAQQQQQEQAPHSHTYAHTPTQAAPSIRRKNRRWTRSVGCFMSGNVHN